MDPTAPSAPETPWRYRRAVDTYRFYDGTDENGIVGTVAPGLFAQEGRCWRMIYESPVGLGGHCMQPVERVGRRKFWLDERCGRVTDTRTSCHGPGVSASPRHKPLLCTPHKPSVYRTESGRLEAFAGRNPDN